MQAVRYTAVFEVGYVDLHSHVLFGLDDGAPDLATAVAMLDGLAALGVTDQWATPHQKASQYLPAWDLVEHTFTALDAARKPGHPTLALAAENMWDDVFHRRIHDKSIPHYRGTPALLIEIPPPLLPVGMLEHLFAFRRDGKVPVLAHPERYQALWDDEAMTLALRRQCAFLIDLAAVGGYHGRREMKQARALLEHGLATAVATDAHNTGDLQQAAEGMAWIDKKLGHATLVRLFDHAPRALLAGDFVD